MTSASWVGGHRAALAQTSDNGMQVGRPIGPPPMPGEPSPNLSPMERQRLAKMEKARQTERQQQLVRDTDKLLDLAKQLKEDVDKSNQGTLSIDVVKKAAEIEKLAKSVKDRMRG